jgi:hypothetical protein
MQLTLPQARAIWLACQGLAAPLGGAPAALVERTGWLRTLGGAEGYLALLARAPGMSLATMDAALQADDLQVLPAARACMYVLPRAHAALGLRVAASLSRKRLLRDFEKVEVPPAEQTAVQAAVLDVLAAGPRSTDALRAALPAGTIRSLGELGKKHGISSTLPAALRLLELDGRIHRRPVTRIDSERYAWHLPTGDIFAGAPAESDAVGLAEALLRVFLAQFGPATLDEFVEWSGMAKREARAGAERVAAQTVAIESLGAALVLPGTLPPTPPEPDPDHVVFLASLDNYVVVRAGARLLADAEHHTRPIGTFGTRGQTLGEARMADSRFVVRGGRLVGLWEYDPDTKHVVWGCWNPRDTHASMAAHAQRVGAFLREQLGHGLVFSLDSVGEQRKRLAALPAQD